MIENNKQSQLQNEVVEKTIEFFKDNNQGYWDLAMRFGKTKSVIDLLKKLYNFEPTILIAYPDNKLKATWQDECVKWGYNNPNITYTNFSSLKKYKNMVLHFFIIDEFHSASSLERKYCIKIMNNDKDNRTLALSGTVSKETQEEWGLKEIVKYDTLTGISDGVLADYQVTVHLVDLDTKVKTPNKKGKLLSEKQKYDNYTYVINQMKQNGQNFMHLALARNRLSLSSIGKIEYTKKLLKKLNGNRVLVFTGLSDVADNLGISSYHSKSTDMTPFIQFQSGIINHLALAAMGKVGVTYPNLDSVILLNFTYNAEESSQILNRAIKLDYIGKKADLHVIALNEPAELKKVKESLSMLDQSKIKYENFKS